MIDIAWALIALCVGALLGMWAGENIGRDRAMNEKRYWMKDQK